MIPWRKKQPFQTMVPEQMDTHMVRMVPGFPAGSGQRTRLQMQETRVQSLAQEDPLKKEMATHSNILAWEIPWEEAPCRVQSMGLQCRTPLGD